MNLQEKLMTDTSLEGSYSRLHVWNRGLGYPLPTDEKGRDYINTELAKKDLDKLIRCAKMIDGLGLLIGDKVNDLRKVDN